MPADDYREGVQGAGSRWQDGADSDESEQNYQSGATDEAADNYQNNASAAGDSYASGVASYLGINEDEVTSDSAYTSGVQGAGESWQQGVSQSGARWRDGIQRASAQDYENAAEEAAEEWFAGYREGVTQD